MSGGKVSEGSRPGQQDLSLDPRYTELSAPIVPESLNSLVPIYSIYEKVRKELKERTGEIAYPIGLRELDQMVWGLHKRELLTVGARTSQGKSVFALEAAKNLATHGQTTLFFSLEMSKEQLIERLLSNMCQIDNTLLRRGQAWSQIEQTDEDFRKWLESAPLVVDDINGYNFKSILEVIDAVHPDFVIVDYVQMISTKGFKDKLSALEDFVKEIHKLGKEKNFGTILISQVNRAGAEGRPLMHQLKHAGILEEHSDSCILLKWEYRLGGGDYFVFVEKNRHGEIGELKIKFEPQYYKFADMTFTTPRRDIMG